jgi:hypothetical protein
MEFFQAIVLIFIVILWNYAKQYCIPSWLMFIFWMQWQVSYCFYGSHEDSDFDGNIYSLKV